MRIRRGGATAGFMLAIALSFAGCTIEIQPPQVTTPTSEQTNAAASPSPTQEATTESSSDDSTTSGEDTSTTEPTSRSSDNEDSDAPPRPDAIDETIYLSGPIILVNRSERPDGSCTGRITDVIVDVRADDDHGIKLAHIQGRIAVDADSAKLGDELRVGISPDNLDNKLTSLEHDEDQFPENSELTACDDAQDPEPGEDDVLAPFYGQWIVKGLPYDAETWYSL